MFVSVIVPCYNHEKYLEERIKSILNQTLSDFEIILLDDLSPDNSAEILKRYSNHPKVSHCIINEKNSGSTFFQWNKGIELAKGDLIWIAESDDVADPHFLEKLVAPFYKNKKLVLAYSQSYRMNENGIVTGSWKDATDHLNPTLFENDFEMCGLEYFEKFLNTGNTIPNASAVVFKKQTYLDVGGANPRLRFIGDWDIWSRIVIQGDIFFSHECLNYFRYHDTSVIAQARKKKDHFENRGQVILFRETLAVFLDNYRKKVNAANQAYYINKERLEKEIRKNASLAIRRGYYKKIIPTSILAIKTVPILVTPIYISKLIIQFILLILITTPYNLIRTKVQK